MWIVRIPRVIVPRGWIRVRSSRRQSLPEKIILGPYHDEGVIVGPDLAGDGLGDRACDGYGPSLGVDHRIKEAVDYCDKAPGAAVAVARTAVALQLARHDLQPRLLGMVFHVAWPWALGDVFK